MLKVVSGDGSGAVAPVVCAHGVQLCAFAVGDEIGECNLCARN